jgi:hypothetical protein
MIIQKEIETLIINLPLLRKLHGSGTISFTDILTTSKLEALIPSYSGSLDYLIKK